MTPRPAQATLRGMRGLPLVLALALVSVDSWATVTGTTSTSGPYVCNGTTTVYYGTFKISATTDLVVTKQLTGGSAITLAAGTDYTATIGGPGSVVTLTAGSKCASGYTLTISRLVPLTQTTSFTTQGTFSPRAHESAFDKATIQVQQVDALIDTTIATHAADKAAQTLRDAAQDTATLTQIGTMAATLRSEMSPAGEVLDARTVLSTGSVTARTLASRFADIKNVKDFGAIGNGVADDTAGIQAAITALPSTGGIVFLPIGTYKVSSAILINKTNTHFIGSGIGTVISATQTTGNVVAIGTLGAAVTDGSIQNIRILPTTEAGSNTLTCLNVVKGQRQDIRKVMASRCGTAGIALTYDSNTLTDNYISYSTIGIHVNTAAHSTRIIGNNDVRDCYAVGVRVSDSSFVLIEGTIQSNPVGVYLYSSTDNVSSSKIRAYFEDNELEVHAEGTALAHRIYSTEISGYMNHGGATAGSPLIRTTYTTGLTMRDLAISGLTWATGLGVYPIIDRGAYTLGFTMEDVDVDGWPYIEPTSYVPAINTPMGRTTLVTDGGFDWWSGGNPMYWRETNCNAEQVITNLVTDASFEASGVDVGWVDGYGAPTLSKQTGTRTGGSGVKVLRVAKSATDNPYTSNYVLQVGAEYRVRGWARGDGTSLPKVYIGSAAVFVGTTSTGWQSFDATASCAGIGEVILQSYGSTYVEFDDLEVFEAYNGSHAKVTAAALSAEMNQTYNIPKQYLGKVVPFIVLGDVKVGSGSGARVRITPIDDAGVTRGKVSQSNACLGDWQVAVGGYGLTNELSTKLRFSVLPDDTGSTGVAYFDNMAVYWGHTPWPYGE